MPRTSRSIVGGHVYHVINRGNNRSTLFHEPEDYWSFLALVGQAQDRITLPILAACLMPNHVHLVLRPQADADVSKWAHWLFTTHVSHYHRKYKTCGRVWQGRFKAFVIQQDEHLITVMRYVERNALRSGLADRAERWRWGSLAWRVAPTSPIELSPPPTPLGSNWLQYVNEAQTSAELEAIRVCVNRQRPFGSPAWTAAKGKELGLTQTLNNIGRPKRRVA